MKASQLAPLLGYAAPDIRGTLPSSIGPEEAERRYCNGSPHSAGWTGQGGEGVRAGAA